MDCIIPFISSNFFITIVVIFPSMSLVDKVMCSFLLFVCSKHKQDSEMHNNRLLLLLLYCFHSVIPPRTAYLIGGQMLCAHLDYSTLGPSPYILIIYVLLCYVEGHCWYDWALLLSASTNLQKHIIMAQGNGMVIYFHLIFSWTFFKVVSDQTLQTFKSTHFSFNGGVSKGKTAPAGFCKTMKSLNTTRLARCHRNTRGRFFFTL